jgi:hypothetical protein
METYVRVGKIREIGSLGDATRSTPVRVETDGPINMADGGRLRFSADPAGDEMLEAWGVVTCISGGIISCRFADGGKTPNAGTWMWTEAR